MIDRLAPTVRPRQAVRGYQQWRSLLFMHWPVPTDTMRAIIPAPLELDLYEGVAYVGIVAFAMQGVRPRWWPRRLAFRFLETNVRAYVTCGNRPGIYFFSLDAAMLPAVWAGRRFWGLPYYAAEMNMSAGEDEIHYRTRRRGSAAGLFVRYRPGLLKGPSPPGSAEFFFLERYLLFVERRRQLWAGQVHHAPYPAQQVDILAVQDELALAAGLGSVSGSPVFNYWVGGVDVEIFGLRPA
jgi:uncharacterized protein YqjF (DUF2071 family)